MDKKFYRMLVLYTLCDEERHEFIDRVQKQLNAKLLEDQSTIAIEGWDKTAITVLKGICSDMKKREKGHFVKAYYAAALDNIFKTQEHFDDLIEETIWESDGTESTSSKDRR